MREVFVGALVAIGIFLLTYKILERSLENTLSVLAGVAVIAVALFPTSPSDMSEIPETPLQSTLGMNRVSVVHFTAAAIFIGALAVITYFFGRSEGERDAPRSQRRCPAFWRRFHWLCAAIIAAAVLAFGASWLFKGAELDVLRRLRREALRHSPSVR